MLWHYFFVRDIHLIYRQNVVRLLRLAISIPHRTPYRHMFYVRTAYPGVACLYHLHRDPLGKGGMCEAHHGEGGN